MLKWLTTTVSTRRYWYWNEPRSKYTQDARRNYCLNKTSRQKAIQIDERTNEQKNK